MIGNLRGRLALATMLAMGTMGASGMAQPTPTVQAVPAKAKRRGLFDGSPMLAPLRAWGYSGPGTTMAQQKRASRKAKNVKRHRASGRG